jgi:teichuronic acid biosynthesis glycosyltransferase TuaG
MKTLIHEKQLVTVIIAMYNGVETIESTINSILEQSYKFINILICDDCSSDNSINKVVDINSSQITLLKNDTNIGLSKTRKKLLSSVKTKYVAFIDQDDTWKNNKIEKQIELMELEKCAMCHTHYNFLIKSLKTKKLIKSKSKIFYIDLLNGRSPGASTVIINTEYFSNLSLFSDERFLDPVNDYVIWLHLFRDSNNYSICLEEPMMDYLFHGNNLSANKLKQLYKHYYVLKNLEKISSFKIFFYVGKNVFNRIKNYLL